MLAWALWDCRLDGRERDRRDLRVLRLPDPHRSATTCPAVRRPASWLGWALVVAGVTVAVLAPVTGVWVDAPHRRRRALAVLTGDGGAADIGDEPDPRRLPTTCWPGLLLLGVHRGVQRPGQRPVQRDAAAAVDAGDVRPGLRIRLGRRLFRQRRAVAYRLSRRSSRATATRAGCWTSRPPTARTFARPCCSPPPGSPLFALPVLIVAPAAGRVEPPARASIGVLRRLPQAVVGDRRRVAARPQLRLLPARQRGVPRRTGRRVHVRRGARRQRLRHLAGRRAAVRRERQRGRRRRCGARRPARRPGRLQAGHRRLAGRDDRRRPDPDGAVRRRWRSGSAGCCCACSSGRRSRRRAP